MYSLIIHGRRSANLQKLCSLIVSANLSKIASAFSDLSPRNPDSVLDVLRTHGFTDSQVSNIIKAYPKLLTSDATEKSLSSKLFFLQSRGASISELTEILSKVPKILDKKEGKSISKYYDFVKDIIHFEVSINHNVSALRESGVPLKVLTLLLNSYGGLPVNGNGKFEESLKKVVEMGFDPKTSKFVQALRVFYRNSDKTLEEKVNIYKRLGLSEADVWLMFKKWPASLTHSEKKITQKFKTLKNYGLLETEILSVFKRFPQCISYSEDKIVNSIETFTSLGFTKDELMKMVKCFPQSLNLSAESVKKKTEFVMKKMNWTVRDVVSNPAVLGYSLEKRTVPRCNVIKVLMSKGLIGSEVPSMSPVLAVTDRDFLEKYVRKYGGDDEELVAELMDIFSGKTSKASE